MKKMDLIFTKQAATLLGIPIRSAKNVMRGRGLKPRGTATDPETRRRSTLWSSKDVMSVVETGEARQKAAKVAKGRSTHGGGRIKGAAALKAKLKRLDAVKDVFANGDYEDYRELLIEEFVEDGKT